MLFPLHFLISFLIVLVCSRHVICDRNTVTSPDLRYHIIWQTPSQDCQSKFAISFVDELINAGITFNTNDRWYGEHSTIFHPDTPFGSWPHYKNGDPPPTNGGLPQLGNLSLHLANVRDSIKNVIPNDTFSGVAVIDMEEWRPLWERNWGWKTIYQTESLALASEINKDKSNDESWIEQEAIRQFTETSRKFMTETLRTSIKLRPGGLWGYYTYPECFNTKPIALHCKQLVQDGNDKMKWLWEESSALFPSIYIFDDGWSANDVGRYMYAIIDESVRLSKLVGGRPVIPYTKIKYDMMALKSFNPKIIMSMSLRMGADFGIEGAIVWSSDRDYETSEGCNQNLEYIRTIISPYTKKLVDFTILCSKKRCSGRDRCVHRGALSDNFAEEIIRDTDEKLDDWVIDDRYTCRCKDGTVAKDCRKAG